MQNKLQIKMEKQLKIVYAWKINACVDAKQIMLSTGFSVARATLRSLGWLRYDATAPHSDLAVEMQSRHGQRTTLAVEQTSRQELRYKNANAIAPHSDLAAEMQWRHGGNNHGVWK